MNAALTGVVAVVDIGNTAIKINRVENGALAGLAVTFPPERANQLVTHEPLSAAGGVVIGCSGSRELAEDLAAQIYARGDEALVLSRDCALPFKSDYAAGQAGVDRLANIAAAVQMTHKSAAIVINAGSAITVEMIAPGGHFRGGVILPGFALQARALNQGTAELPLVQVADEMEAMALPGTNTAAAIRAGIHYACVGAVEKVVRDFLARPEMVSAQVIVTGGDGPAIAAALANVYPQMQVDPQLTLRGLLALARCQ